MDTEKRELFEHLFSSVNGYLLSSVGRKKLDYINKAHTYGEVTYDGFKEMLAYAKPKPDEIFYDLGSGTGKAVILANLFAPFKKLVGVEMIEPLWEASNKVLLEYRKLLAQESLITNNKSVINFMKSDFKDVSIDEADVIYMNATCFDYELNNMPFVRKIENLRVGTRIITNSTPIFSRYYDTEKKGESKFTWGTATIYLHTKFR